MPVEKPQLPFSISDLTIYSNNIMEAYSEKPGRNDLTSQCLSRS